MKKETIGNCDLYLGDCRDVMPILPSFDAVVTDPPYGIGASCSYFHRARRRGASYASSRDYGDDEWDNTPCPQEQIDFIRAVSRKQIIFGGNYFSLPPSRCWLVWDKQNGSNSYADCEMAWTNLNKSTRLISWQWHGMLRKGNEERFHPTQKPVGVMEWCLAHIPDCKSILDPFMGSGTTGVACVRQGRFFTGIEREKKHFDVACRRIEAAYAQPDMFVAQATAPPIQDNLL